MEHSMLPTKILAGVRVVDTPLVQAAQSFARVHSNDAAYNHVMRSWILGTIIYSRLREKDAIPPIDIEAHAVSAILHDLGWDHTGELISSDKRFEVDGAIAARSWINDQKRSGNARDWDDHRIQLVWDAIALHTTASIARHKEPIVEVCRLGIMSDFQGPNSDESGTLTWDDFNTVKKEFPRHDLGKSVRELFTGFCRTKPAATFDGQAFALSQKVFANAVADKYQRGFGIKYVEGYKEKLEVYDQSAAQGVADALGD